MADKFTQAKFWKCALQVNPAGYIACRGAHHGMTKQQMIDNRTKVVTELSREHKAKYGY